MVRTSEPSCTIVGNCRIPDDCIDNKRYPLFMGRLVMSELIMPMGWPSALMDASRMYWRSTASTREKICARRLSAMYTCTTTSCRSRRCIRERRCKNSSVGTMKNLSCFRDSQESLIARDATSSKCKPVVFCPQITRYLHCFRDRQKNILIIYWTRCWKIFIKNNDNLGLGNYYLPDL